jgi:hypothetical protein
MIPNFRISQAIVQADARGARVVAQTDDFDAPEAERIAVLFGTRPAGVPCPLAHFACPFGSKHVAVVRAQVRPGPGDTIAFRILVLTRELSRHLGDPFAISDRYPVDWNAAATLPLLEWPAEPLPERTVEQLDGVLKNGDSSLLLGAAQALVDGNRVLIQRNAPDEALARGLWQLLPDRSRVDLWPASFAFSNELGLHFAVLPSVAPEVRSPALLTEEAVRDYPQSRYELNLQIAIESGDRAALRRLLARRTVDESIRLALYMLAVALIIALVFRFAV